jgi:transposase
LVDGTALWFDARGYEVVRVDECDDGELVITVQSTATTVGCPSCGVRARAKDRRLVSLRGAPHGSRPVRVVWHKRVWSCPDADCAMRTWTERDDELAAPRRVLTTSAARWACEQLCSPQQSTAGVARTLGVSWSTAWSAVLEHGQPQIDDPQRIPEVVEMAGFDETVMQPASRGRRRRFITAVVDVTTSQILDVFEGRNAQDLRAWLIRQPWEWRAQIRVVSVDPHEGYRNALTVGATLADDVTLVVDPFHIVRLANMALTRCRQRVQQQLLGHRGRTTDPLYGLRKLLLLGAERVDERGWQRIHAALAAGDPDDEVRDCWVAKEYVRDIYLTDDPVHAEAALDRAIAWCDDHESPRELRRLAKTLKRWRAAILAHHDTGASNGRVEAANLTIKQVKRAGRGYRNLRNYRLRILLAAGRPRDTQRVTSLRARPRSVA